MKCRMSSFQVTILMVILTQCYSGAVKSLYPVFTLYAPKSIIPQTFGAGIAINNKNTLVVGAPNVAEVLVGSGPGSIYVYKIINNKIQNPGKKITPSYDQQEINKKYENTKYFGKIVAANDVYLAVLQPNKSPAPSQIFIYKATSPYDHVYTIKNNTVSCSLYHSFAILPDHTIIATCNGKRFSTGHNVYRINKKLGKVTWLFNQSLVYNIFKKASCQKNYH